MPTIPLLTKLFYTLAEFQTLGGPCRGKSYKLDDEGVIELSKDAAGRTGLTADEVRRYFSNVQPLARRDTSKATAASLLSDHRSKPRQRRAVA